MKQVILYDKLNNICINVNGATFQLSAISYEFYIKVIELGTLTLGDFVLQHNDGTFRFIHNQYNLTFSAKSSIRFYQIFEKLFDVLEVK